MATLLIKSSARVRRELIKNEFWAEEIAWTGEGEKGWFRAPRTLPVILTLLSAKEVSGKLDPSRVYLDLLARHRDSGIVDMAPEGEHSFAAGYPGTRGIRTWKERMKLLEQLGFIKTRIVGNVQFGHVLLVHPTFAVQNLRHQGKVPEKIWDMYRTTQIRTKEATYEQRVQAIEEAKAAAVKKIEEAKAAAAKTATASSAAESTDARAASSKKFKLKIADKTAARKRVTAKGKPAGAKGK